MNLATMRRRTGAALAGLALTLGAVTASALPASAATRVSGINIWTACSQQFGTPSYVVLRQYNVMGWACQYHGGWNAVYLGVDLNKYCRVNVPGTTARYTNFNDPYSWGCYR